MQRLRERVPHPKLLGVLVLVLYSIYLIFYFYFFIFFPRCYITDSLERMILRSEPST